MDPEAAKAYLAAQGLPIVVKADGLAAGKGVIIARRGTKPRPPSRRVSRAPSARPAAEVVIEEFLEGEEASFFALVDGETALPLASAQDHKRVGDGDTGPNTGGMGAYSPAPIVTPEMADRAMREIITPTVKAMAARGMPFKGVLFAGLMISASGPKLIEFNVRFGDPETQVLMMRLKSDLLAALLATVDGVLSNFDLRWSDDAALTVVMAANGYPGKPMKRHRDQRSGRGEGDPGRRNFSRRYAPRRRAPCCRRRTRIGCHRPRAQCCRGAGRRLCRDRQDRLAGRLLSQRHRLARLATK